MTERLGVLMSQVSVFLSDCSVEELEGFVSWVQRVTWERRCKVDRDAFYEDCEAKN